MTLQHVVVGVDGSLVSVRALDQAAEEAARRGIALRVVYAVPDRDEAGPVLASAASRVRERHPAVPVETRAEEGGVVRALVRESTDAVLTVVGTRGLGGLAGWACGAVSSRLAAQAHGPLLVVRGERPHDDPREVLLGLESDISADAALYAIKEAERRGARLRVLDSWTHRHTSPELPSLVPATSPGHERHPRTEFESRTVRTTPAQALVEATRDAAVVVIGSHRPGSRHGGHLGPVAHALLHHSHCPVVVVPTG
ncbi:MULTISPECIES: universal stress protein [unclassified Streptomyces]|uniref:universal stress protein n=1 Tax=unclassified Streptomyces TaxID=2593676 RepID=UPI002DDA74B1|nr:universal stress protein [Streptomyces sp. NBC_01750]WSB01402.1 universal stress protein [Streptomyces sp. NBC_01794]WSD34250.1 universal stress protein [Streptomyces sp. NBC_01750]